MTSDHFRAQDHTQIAPTAGSVSQSGGVSRRRFFATGARIGAGLALPGLVGAAISNRGVAAETGHAVHVGTPHQGFSETTGVPRIPFTEGAPLSEPEVRRSVNSELRTTLRVQYAYKRSMEPGQSYDIEIAIPADHMVEEWTLVNLHFHDHIFHIHINPFQ